MTNGPPVSRMQAMRTKARIAELERDQRAHAMAATQLHRSAEVTFRGQHDRIRDLEQTLEVLVEKMEQLAKGLHEIDEILCEEGS